MSKYEELNNLIIQLQKTKEIFTKNPNRIFKSEYVLNKITLKNNIRTEFNRLVSTFDNPLDKKFVDEKIAKFKIILDKLEIIFNKLSGEILNNSKLLDDNNDNIFQDNIEINKNLNMEFDFTKHSKIIPVFDGESKNFTNFINLVELVYDSLNDAGKVMLINFVMKTKLTDPVRTKLSIYPNPNNFANLKENFSKIIRSSRTALSIQNELSRVKQNNSTLLEFSSKIETLIAELNSIQIRQSGEEHRDIIAKINDEIGLNAFKSGLNDKLRSTVLAGRPTALNDAINLAFDSDIPQESEAKVFYSKSTNKKKFNENKFSKFCRYCKKKGHELHECYKKKNSDSKKVNHTKASGNDLSPEESGIN